MLVVILALLALGIRQAVTVTSCNSSYTSCQQYQVPVQQVQAP